MPIDQPPPKHRIRAEHTGERITDLRLTLGVGVPVFIVLLVAEVLLRATGRISTPVLIVLLPANFLILAGLIRLVQYVTSGTAEGFARTVYGAGNIAPEPGFSSEEAMIMQGRLADAEASFRQRLLDHPAQYQAALRLGALLVQSGRPEEAERIYLELRRGPLPSTAAMTVANRLIDLYERGGRGDRLKVELARFSGEWKGTGAGEHANRRLRELKEEDRQRNEEHED